MTIIQSILSRLTEAVNGTDKELYTEDELNKFATFYLDKWDENTSGMRTQARTLLQSLSLISGGTLTGLAEGVLSVAN